MEEQKLCAIYARVSPTKHIKTENDLHASLEESLKMCHRDAENEGYTVYKEYIDEYVSGKSSKFMPSFNNMLEDARQHKFIRVYSRRVNRFGRNRNDMIRAQMELEELGISLKFAENGFDTAQPFGKSIMAFMAEAAQMDREEILENTKRGREARREKGLPFGRKIKEPRILSIKQIRANRLLSVTDPNKYTWFKLEEMTGLSRSTIISKLKAAGYWDYERRCVK